jgi:hypothetical protein
VSATVPSRLRRRPAEAGAHLIAVARLAGEAEEVGWHGVFVWDHVRWREPVVEVAEHTAAGAERARDT